MNEQDKMQTDVSALVGSAEQGPGRHFQSALKGFFDHRVRNSAVLFGLVPIGTAFGRWIGKVIALPQLRKLAVGEIPWAPLRKPLSECTVALVSTGGVHLRSDRPFNLNGDPTFRVIRRRRRPAISPFHIRLTTGLTPSRTSIWFFPSSGCANSKPKRLSGDWLTITMASA
jgi:hypothetical protein